MEIVSARKNCMGTISFTLRIGKMKKAEEFITYPIQRNDDGKRISLQSHHRWAFLYTESGRIEMSARRNQYANSWFWLECKRNGTLEIDQCTPNQLAKILAAIQPTASPMAGSNGIMYCDNSGASQLTLQTY